ncbi:MAG: MotA/TolQ/ExbB proton channel family protein [Candidatus Omnitrophica bacterium]|nr:MotA/TolQ/ExbB proton channel family protein [Candidatus Omnitrophota bacterium]
MFEFFQKGGPVMWPLLFTSLAALTVVIERIIFIVRERRNRRPDVVEKILAYVERGDVDNAVKSGQQTQDFVAKALVYGLTHRQQSFSNALLLAANQELKRFSQGLSTLDTIITLAPLLGLLGTVTGMIHAFGLLGNKELETPTVITGGVSEALIATAFGLFIAIVALIPFNYLNGRLEDARQEIEDAATYLELLIVKLTNKI